MKIQRGYFFASSATQKATLIVSQPHTNKLRFCEPSTVFQQFECDNYDFWDVFSKSKAFFLILIYALELCVMFICLNSNKYN